MFFMSYGWKCVNVIQSRWVGLIGVRWVKSFEVWKIMLWVEKTSESGWEVWYFILRKVFSLENLDGMEKLTNSKLNPLSSQKTK